RSVAARSLRVLALVAALLALAACAAAPSGRTAGGGGASLEQRSLERWQALIEGDQAKAYGYLSPGYRATRSLENYRAGSRAAALNWSSVKWRGEKCSSEDSCVATLLLDYSVKMTGAGDVPGFRQLTEQWVRLDGTWYHVPER